MNAECYDCGLDYENDRFGDLILPDRIWQQIAPRKGSNGILCPNCIAKRLADRNIRMVKEVTLYV